MNMSISGVWLKPLVGYRLRHRRGLIQGMQTIDLTLLDLTPAVCGSSDAIEVYRTKFTAGAQPGDNSVKKWAEPVLPGE